MKKYTELCVEMKGNSMERMLQTEVDNTLLIKTFYNSKINIWTHVYALEVWVDINFLEHSIYAFVLLERSLIGEVWVSLVISNAFSAVIKISTRIDRKCHIYK